MLKSFLGSLIGLGRMFHGLLGVFVSGLVIFLTVMRGGNTVSVRGQLVHLGGSLMPITLHDGLLSFQASVRTQTRQAADAYAD